MNTRWDRAGSETPEPAPATDESKAAPAGDPSASPQAEGKPTVGGQELSKEEQQQVQKLRARDAEVRAHEAAHLAAGGAHVRGGASYSYQQGPDGKQYAIGGEVGIDVSAVPNDPQATIQKMQQVRAAALAPASPSGADRSVASAASQTEMKARQQLAERSARAYEAHSGGNGGAGGEGQAMDGTAKPAGAQTTQRSIKAWA